MQFTQKNIQLIYPLIVDSDFHVRDLPPENQKGIRTFPIRRPYWEKPIKQKVWGIFKRTLVKEVYSKLTFEKVESLKYNWKDPAFSAPDDHHSFLHILFNETTSEFILDTVYLEITIKLMQDFKVVLEDTSAPGDENFLNIIGWDKFDYQEWEKEYNKQAQSS